MLVVVGILVGAALAFGLFVHALRADTRDSEHRWIVVVPLVIMGGWLLVQLIMG